MAGSLSQNYSLWLEPAAGTLRDRLQREIRAQAAAHGGPYFEPHVTLLPDIQLDRQQLLDAAAGLAKRIKVRANVALPVARRPATAPKLQETPRRPRGLHPF
jgi:hypothetical protein